MPISDSCARSWAMLAPAAVALAATLSAQTRTETDVLIARVGERIAEFYSRAQSLVCFEKVTAQPVGTDRSPVGFGRTLEYELRIEPDGDSDKPNDAHVVRELLKVNGRKPRPQDAKSNDTCLDPNPLSPEPLAFLLPEQRGEYVFTWAGFGKGKDSRAMMIDFRPVEIGKAQFLEDKEGRPDCFQISLPAERSGRLWIDADSYDVLRMEQHLRAPVDVRVPFARQRSGSLPDLLVVDRYDSTTQYKRVAFTDPIESILLPESIHQLVLIRGAQSHYKHQVFSNYRRFMTQGRIVKE